MANTSRITNSIRIANCTKIRKSNKDFPLQEEKNVVKYRRVKMPENACFSFSSGRTKMDVLEHDDVIHLILYVLALTYAL